MDFTPTPDQELLRDTARSLLVNECPPTVVRAHRDDPAAADPLWGHLREFSALGAGPVVDHCVFADETGYVAAPGPFLATTALFLPLLVTSGGAVDAALVDAVAEGSRTGTVALAGPDGTWVPTDAPTRAFVPEADRVDVVALVTRTDGGVRVVLADTPPVVVTTTIDSSRRLATLTVADLDPGAPSCTLDAAAVGAVVERATVVLAAELVGTARRLLDMSLAYAKERHQFGVPIGSFQAIQHKLADMSLDVERASSAVYAAAMTLDADPDDPAVGPGGRARAVHIAKAAAGEAAKHLAKDAIQIHGGIGYTWEHDLHLFIRRAYGSEALLGTTGWHHDRLADLLFA